MRQTWTARLAGGGGHAWRWGAAVLVATLVGVLVSLVVDGVGEHGDLPVPVLACWPLYNAVGVVMAGWAFRHRGLDRQSRRAWGVITIGLIMLGLSGALRRYYPLGTGFPSPADALRLAFAPVLLTGLLMLPIRVRGRRTQHKIWLDTTIVTIGSGMLLWQVELGGYSGGRISGNALLAALAYPALDLVMVFGAIMVLLRGAAASVRIPAMLIIAAMVLLVIGDAWLGYRQSHYGDGLAGGWQFACWISAEFLLAMAAYAQVRLVGTHRLTTEDPTARTAARLPYLTIGLSYALLIVAVRGYPMQTVGLVVGAVAMTAAVVARQVVALRENHALATTDPLTGLVNRRRFYERLRLASARCGRGGQPVAAVLIDMNGFKQVNDTMGHEAGDQLLVAFGRILRANVLGSDVVGRIGGDEFSILLHTITSPCNVLAVLNRIITEMEVPVMIGDVVVHPQASFGVAIAEPGEFAPDELMRRADAAMYRAKSRGVTGFDFETSAESLPA